MLGTATNEAAILGTATIDTAPIVHRNYLLIMAIFSTSKSYELVHCTQLNGNLLFGDLTVIVKPLALQFCVAQSVNVSLLQNPRYSH